MQKQKFRVGDKVVVRQTEAVIAAVKFCPEMSGEVLVCYLNGQASVERRRIEQTWKYRIWGKGINSRQWYREETLSSCQPCPNCESKGWDWVTGCVECSLSPEDLI